LPPQTTSFFFAACAIGPIITFRASIAEEEKESNLGVIDKRIKKELGPSRGGAEISPSSTATCDFATSIHRTIIKFQPRVLDHPKMPTPQQNRRVKGKRITRPFGKFNDHQRTSILGS